MVYLTVAVGSDTITELVVRPNDIHPVKPFNVEFTAILSMPVVLFAYTCQVNVFAIYDELQERRPRKMLKVGGYAMLLCLSIYSIVGMLGYTRFGDETKGDILTNYDFKSSPILIKGTFITMGVAITTAFPLNVFPLRTSLNLMVFGVPQLQSNVAHLTETLLIVVSMLLAAIYIPGIDIVFSLLGSTASSLLCFIFPAYLAYCAGTHRTSRAVCVGMVLLALLGLFIGILGTWCTISERILK
jgi:amino acid permease